MACSDTSGYQTAYDILVNKGSLILFSGFNDVDFKQDDFYPEVIHRNEYKHYTDKKILIGSYHPSPRNVNTGRIDENKMFKLLKKVKKVMDR